MTQPCFCLLFLGQIPSIRKVCLVCAVLIVAFEIPEGTPTDYTYYTRGARFGGLRLGVPRDRFFDLDGLKHQEIIDAANAAILKMKALGATIQDPADLPSVSALRESTSEKIVLGKTFHYVSVCRNGVQSRPAEVSRRVKLQCRGQLRRFDQFQ
jgi:Asp-tRNA(Asn)/Glu-tRNA(Gln) amidotransferase A subunit family amidase